MELLSTVTQWYSQANGNVYHTSRKCPAGRLIIKNGNAIKGRGERKQCKRCKQSS